MPKEFELIGLEEVDKLFEDVKNISNKTITKAAREASKIVTKEARVRARKIKVTGTTAKSIKHKLEKSRKKGKKVFRVGFTGDGWYGRFHEYGTKNIKATPMLRPALENNVEKIREIILETLAKGVDRVK